MTAPTAWNGNALTGAWLATYKLDGVRALMTPSGAVSRAGKALNNLAQHLPTAGMRDVEVYLGSFEATIAAVRSKGTVPVPASALYLLDPPDPRLVVATVTDPTPESISRLLTEARGLGFEGLVLRQGTTWLKVKPSETYDVPVTAILPGTGRNAGRMGAVATPRGNVSAGFSDVELATWWREREARIGTVIEVECTELTKRGKFRSPRFLRERPDKAPPAPTIISSSSIEAGNIIGHRTPAAPQPAPANAITIGYDATGAPVALPLRLANRHGLVTGATGTGKTVTLQRLAEEFSRAGVPVFAADIKGDLSGLAAEGAIHGPAADRAAALGILRTPEKFPVSFWDLWGEMGMPIRTSVHEMGPLLLARMLQLNETQEGVLNIAFRWSPWGEDVPMRDLHDLRARLSLMPDHADDIKARFGNIATASIATIQRACLVLEAQGGHNLFGEPALTITDFMRTDHRGYGVVNLLHADRLMDTPRLYGTFLLWLLASLFNALPEAGDLDKPKLVFFFDEAHLLFAEATPRLMETIERVVRLIRSKGVGVYFVTQSPRDVPDAVSAQLGNRVQHALRVFTPKDRRTLRAISEGFRTPDGMTEATGRRHIEDTVLELGTGEAMVSTLEGGGVPGHVRRVKIVPPAAQIGPVSDFERDAVLRADPLHPRYAHNGTREEQFAMFLARLQAKGEIPPAPPAPTAAAAPAGKPSWWARLTGGIAASAS